MHTGEVRVKPDVAWSPGASGWFPGLPHRGRHRSMAPRRSTFFVLEAAIVGEAGRLRDVTAYPPGTLVSDEVLQPLFSFAVAEREVSIAAGAFFAGEFPAEEGEGVLGVSGVCGRGWSRDGSRVTADPCSAASPVTPGSSPGSPRRSPSPCYPRTESGQVRPGRYQVEIPLAASSGPSSGALRVGFEAVPRDRAGCRHGRRRPSRCG